ncbi:MAG: F0F1 ATP synthase subunit epsilon [Clostridia bacterium]|nr:F0F1 ATP synthase subunit epsilon [Clostridia bacterium]
MNTFKLQIAAPDGMRYDGDAVQISVRGIEGDLAVMAGHIPFVTALKSGECRVYTDEKTIRRANCSGGMLMVSKDCVRLLSSDFTWVNE